MILELDSTSYSGLINFKSNSSILQVEIELLDSFDITLCACLCVRARASYST